MASQKAYGADTRAKRPVLGGRPQVRVAVAQISSVFMDKTATVRRAVEAIAEAANNGAELIVFPEVWLAGYPFWTEGWDTNVGDWAQGRVIFHDAAITIPGEETQRIGEAARRHGVHVVMGCNELDDRQEVQTIYNTLVYFGRNGEVMGRHRKLMPTFTERLYWGHGDAGDIVAFDTDIGRIGGLICGEHLMTLVRAAVIAEGEDIHVAVYPGSFALHTGPRLQEPDRNGFFWGHFSTRAHAMEAGAFVLCACGVQDAADIADDFPYKGRMNIDYAIGGSQILSPLGVPIIGPVFGSQIVYADLQAAMLKATKAICDTMGHYGRPDVVRLLLRGESGWHRAGASFREASERPAIERGEIRRQADAHEVEEDNVSSLADRIGRIVG